MDDLLATFRCLRISISTPFTKRISEILEEIQSGQLCYFVRKDSSKKLEQIFFENINENQLRVVVAKYYWLKFSQLFESGEEDLAIYSLLLIFYLRKRFPSARLWSRVSPSTGCVATVLNNGKRKTYSFCISPPLKIEDNEASNSDSDSDSDSNSNQAGCRLRTKQYWDLFSLVNCARLLQQWLDSKRSLSTFFFHNKFVARNCSSTSLNWLVLMGMLC